MCLHFSTVPQRGSVLSLLRQSLQGQRWATCQARPPSSVWIRIRLLGTLLCERTLASLLLTPQTLSLCGAAELKSPTSLNSPSYLAKPS